MSYFFRAQSKYFSDKDVSAPRKNGPYAYGAASFAAK